VTGAQTLAAFRRALVPVLLTALLTLAGVVGLMMSRPPSYQVRVGLIATAMPGRASGSMDFGQVVNLGMPSLPEFVAADDVITAIRTQVPKAPSADVLRTAITVELVPASGVARISVTTDDPETSRQVLSVLLRRIAVADLLSPVATLRPIGTADPAPEVVGRDPLLAIGLGLVAAIAVSLLTTVVVQTLRPRLLTRSDVERIVDGIYEGEPPPPVVEVHRDGRGVDLLAAYLIAQDPQMTEVKVVASGPALPGDFAREVQSTMRKIITARDAGLALEPFGSPAERSARGGWRQPARHVTTPAYGPAPGGVADGVPGDEQDLTDDVLDELAETLHDDRTGTRVGAGSERATGSSAPRRGPGPITGALLLSAAERRPSGRSGNGTDPDTHLVVTVRLRRTTPVALTTALITLRTHGTGVAGVAVS
jgi:capsular polysaccharide biosynthesis protein